MLINPCWKQLGVVCFIGVKEPIKLAQLKACLKKISILILLISRRAYFYHQNFTFKNHLAIDLNLIYHKGMTDRTLWIINIIGQAKKADKNLSKDAAKSFVLLLKELKLLGPYRASWPNYTKMPRENYHCHIEKGRPTYVVCWQIVDKKAKIIEVYTRLT